MALSQVCFHDLCDLFLRVRFESRLNAPQDIAPRNDHENPARLPSIRDELLDLAGGRLGQLLAVERNQPVTRLETGASGRAGAVRISS